ncbi:Do family serine endopeptidase [Cohaesibacter intestini]|uniref:Do family serine endopeptidase n=1 Tax=Cohaesibacter intestini TaxID=2211145 RepID=UPI0018E5A81D|nr:Do family serine endopeptidase [Cohaesibacter intestini]
MKTIFKKVPVKATMLASALSLGVVAGATVPTLMTGQPAANAEPVQVTTPARPLDFTAVVKAVKPAVVSVQVKTQISTPEGNKFGIPGFPEFRDLPKDHPFNRFFRRFGEEQEGNGEKRKPRPRFGQSQGSGFFISDDGLVVTNHHVIDKGSEFTLVMDDGSELEADLLGSDERSDLALLRVKNPDRKFDYVRFAEELPDVGEWVLAVGNPFGLGGTVTAGIVSAHGRDINARNYESFIQIDAAVNKGNSGGPTFNLKGEVIGVNTAIFSPSGGNVGIAFAIPAEVAKDVVADLKNGGKVKRGWLGVHIQNVSEDIADSLGLAEAAGAMVTHTDETAPAYKAGVQIGDVILAVDDVPVKNTRELARAIGRAEPESDVELTIWREDQEIKLKVHLGLFPDQVSNDTDEQTQPQQPAAPAEVEEFGLELQASPDGDGVAILSVDSNSIAAEKGLAEGDVIQSVAGKKVATIGDVRKQLSDAKSGNRKTILMRVKTKNGVRFVALPLKGN